MDILSNISVIIFDFDGVIIDSMEVRDYGFREIFKDYPNDKVEELINYHRVNGGLSRFHKIKYFYENIINKDIDEEKIIAYAKQFSEIMREELIKDKYLIDDCVEFIIKNSNKYELHIASGSEEKELRYLCNKLGIEDNFISINGSPTNKNELVKNIIKKSNYQNEKIVMIGDSINDYEAANANNIKFVGYNNEELKILDEIYLETFKQFNKVY